MNDYDDLPVRYQPYEINRDGESFVIWDKINSVYIKDGGGVMFFTTWDEANDRVNKLIGEL
jgi:hypothetical protein